jgi:hypothetical protein
MQDAGQICLSGIAVDKYKESGRINIVGFESKWCKKISFDLIWCVMCHELILHISHKENAEHKLCQWIFCFTAGVKLNHFRR